MSERGPWYRRLGADQRGQTMSEYLVLAGVTTAIAIVMSRMLGGSVKQAFASVAQRMLAVITGYP
jgi:Flp pilus assembly pilin Flp